MQNTQASYPRVCTHESQSFSTELLESKGIGIEHLTQTDITKHLLLNPLSVSIIIKQFHTLHHGAPELVVQSFLFLSKYNLYYKLKLQIFQSCYPLKFLIFRIRFQSKKNHILISLFPFPFSLTNQGYKEYSLYPETYTEPAAVFY